MGIVHETLEICSQLFLCQYWLVFVVTAAAFKEKGYFFVRVANVPVTEGRYLINKVHINISRIDVEL